MLNATSDDHNSDTGCVICCPVEGWIISVSGGTLGVVARRTSRFYKTRDDKSLEGETRKGNVASMLNVCSTWICQEKIFACQSEVPLSMPLSDFDPNLWG